jgi:uncharacterized protein YjbI with pentapeptide repeats
MAKKRHLAALKKGIEAWNEWRLQNPKTKPDLSKAYLGGANLRRAILGGADLDEADLGSANLAGTDLAGANLRGTWLRWADLCGATLVGANLDQAKLVEAKLMEANLIGATFFDADLGRANLRKANLAGAHLNGANLREAELSGADLGRADLRRANLSGAKLDGADLTASLMVDTVVGALDLSVANGLETVKHEGPSTVGIDTIYRSKGQIPEVFLRGAGVPENFIVYMKSLAGVPSAFEYYSCFVSYSTKDQEFADLLHAQLQSKGTRVWLATEDLKIGDKFRVKIDEAIRLYDKLLLVLSKDSVKSLWVEAEVEAAFEKERKQGRTGLFPIRLDDAVMETEEAWAAEIRRTRHIGDFRRWKNHDDYKKAFERLMRDLKA